MTTTISDILWGTGLLVYVSYTVVLVFVAIGAFKRRGGRRFFDD